MKAGLPLALGLGLVFCAVAQRPVSLPPDLVGQSLGELQATFVSSNPGPLDGKVVLIQFWSVRNPASRRTIPHFNRIQRKYQERGLVVIGISNDSDEALAALVKVQPVHFSLASDPEARLFHRLGVTFIPFCLLVDRAGKIVWQGAPNMIPDELIPKFLDQPASPTAPTPPQETPAPVEFAPGPRPGWY